MLPYLKETDDDSARLLDIASILREWTIKCEDVNPNLSKCNRTYTRFTTSGMNELLPDIPNAPSGWNTDNHYFYEIINRSGTSFYIQFCLSARNATEEFLSICDRINDVYPAKIYKENWLWRTPFKTPTMGISEDYSKGEIFSKLDTCLKEIQLFEIKLHQVFR